MSGNNGNSPHVDEPTVLDRLLDLLLTSPQETQLVLIAARKLQVSATVLGSAIRGLELSGIVTSSGNSRQFPGLPAVLRVTGEVSHRRRCMAAYRMRAPEPEPPRRTVVKLPRCPVVESAQPQPQPPVRPPGCPKGTERKPPARPSIVKAPSLTRRQRGEGKRLLMARFDQRGRGDVSLAFCRILAGLSDGRAYTRREVEVLADTSYGFTRDNLRRLVKMGAIRVRGLATHPHYQLTSPLGFAVAAAARDYADAWEFNITTTMAHCLRYIARHGTGTSPEITATSPPGRTRWAVSAALRDLARHGLIEIQSGSGGGASPYVYKMTQEGRRQMACV